MRAEERLNRPPDDARLHAFFLEAKSGYRQDARLHAFFLEAKSGYRQDEERYQRELALKGAGSSRLGANRNFFESRTRNVGSQSLTFGAPNWRSFELLVSNSLSKYTLKIMISIENQFIKIPAGSLQMRDDRKQKIWTAEISPFLISKHQVTQELYTFVMDKNPSAFQDLKCPVENVSWLDCLKFCNKLSALHGFRCSYEINDDVPVLDKTANGYRLPTEAEWEYACKAGSNKPRYGELSEIAWYSGNSEGKTQPVGLKKPNDWGLYDMLGNVWEWCEDLYDPEVYGTYRVFRGGGWSDPERGCLATNRRRSMQTYQIDDLGFRIARSDFP